LAIFSRYASLPLDDLGVVLNRTVGDFPMREVLVRWQKQVLDRPERVNFAIINDLSEWTGVISEDDVYAITAWSARFRADNKFPDARLGRLAWIGRKGAGLNLLTEMFNNIRPQQAYHASSAQEAWELVLPEVKMPSKAKKFFKRGLIF
jgi:hypothetical protein